MSYYWFNRQELLEKAKGRYHNSGGKKEAEYYIANKDVLKEKGRNKYRTLLEENKEEKREYSRNRYKRMKTS